MKFSVVKQHFNVNRSISEVWEDIREVVYRYDGKVSNVNKVDTNTWCFTFSFSRNSYTRFPLALINGKIISKEDNETVVDIESNIDVFTIIMITTLLIITLISGTVKANIGTYLLKFLVMGAILIFSICTYNKEANISIGELTKRINKE